MNGTGRTIVALTGGTGFLGHHLVGAFSRSHWHVRVLSRSGTVPEGTDEIVRGDLYDSAALTELLAGADMLIHAAGLVKARSAAEFRNVNVGGTKRILGSIDANATHMHVVVVSSLAAREPALSAYAASKSEAECIARECLSCERLTIVRPPALYGPGDRATLSFFKAARLPITPLPGNGHERIALMHAEDAAAAIAMLAASRAAGSFALADDRPEGYSMREILYEAGRAQNRIPRFAPVPAPVLATAGYAASGLSLLLRRATMLSPGKVREILHQDWSVPPTEMPDLSMHPPRSLPAGFVETVEWYREAGWL